LGGRFINASGAWRGESANVCLPSLRAQRSNHLSFAAAMDCFASLAMTAAQSKRCWLFEK
jgi:hypothetical protein